MPNRALVAQPSARAAVELQTVAEPRPGPGRCVLSVAAASLNRGDLNDARSGRVPAGDVLGSDAAGTVLYPATDGNGPPAGTRVLALTAGAFAQRVAVDMAAVAPVPDGVALDHAATLPVAGLAALQSLRAAGVGAGRRVLVTGAAGGVGRFAVQLAALAGARVTASVSAPGRESELRSLGAAEVRVGLAGADEVDIVIDNVGGPQLVAAWNLLAPGGRLQSVGWSSGEPATFAPYSTIGSPRYLASFLIGADPSADLAADLRELLDHLAAGRLTVTIGWYGPLGRAAEALDALQQRRLSGKVVFDLLA